MNNQKPVLRSRKGQSTAILRIDHGHGLPPPFVPHKLQPLSSALGVTSPVYNLPQAAVQTQGTSRQSTSHIHFQDPGNSRHFTTQAQSQISGSSYQSTTQFQSQTPGNFGQTTTQAVYQTPANPHQPTSPVMYQTSSSSGKSIVRGEKPYTAQSFTFSPEPQRHGMAGNPFGLPAPQGQIVPITLPPPPPGRVSLQLAKIAPRGAKPSPEVALDLNNLPFVESLRSAHPKDHGVIHIANVSISLSTFDKPRADIIIDSVCYYPGRTHCIRWPQRNDLQ